MNIEKVDMAEGDDRVPTFDANSPAFVDIVTRLRYGSAARDASGEALHPYFRALAETGFGAARVPRSLGGAGISIVELFDLVYRLAVAEPNLAHAFRNHFGWVEGLIKPDLVADNRTWIEEVVSGRLFGGSFHEHSDQPAGRPIFETRLSQDGDGFRLNGRKAYSTGNLYVDWLVVAVGDTDGDAVSVVIPADRAGVKHLDDWDGIGQRLSGSGTTQYDNVRIAQKEVHASASAIRTRPWGSAFNQLWLTTVVAGIVQAAVEDTAEFVRGRRRNYYHGLAELPRHDPGVLQSFGEQAAQSFVITAAVREAARALEQAWNSGGGIDIDPGQAHAASAAALQAKVTIDALAQQVSSALMDVGGATAATARARLDRHWRNIRTLISHNPRAYKARYLGDFLINGTLFPSSAYF